MAQTTQTPANGIESFVKQFSRLESAQQPDWLLPLRQAGMARFTELGFPTLRDEDWRFTNIAPIVELPFKPALAPAADGAAKTALKKQSFTSWPARGWFS